MMWPFKKKLVEEKPIEVGSFYSLNLDDPFNTATVKILDVQKNSKGEYWVKYTFVNDGALKSTMAQKTFLSMYTYISPPVKE